MHITLEADYAIRIVYCLAVHQRRMDAKTISEVTGVTLRFSLKILRKLVAAGLVKSFKGTQGGYEIGRELEHINLYDIITTIEGEYALNRCISEEFICTRKKDKPCEFQKIFREISQIVQDKLKNAKLSDIV